MARGGYAPAAGIVKTVSAVDPPQRTTVSSSGVGMTFSFS
jgi:hypothetical protein